VTEEGRRESSMEELSLADEKLDAADSLLAAGLARVSLPRAYFAALHAARLLLYPARFVPRTRARVSHLFPLPFVQSARLVS